MNPEDYRNKPVRLNNFTKPQLILNYTLVDEGVPLITDGIVLEIRRKLTGTENFIGLTVEEPINQIPGNGEPGVDSLAIVWDKFHDIKSSISELAEGGEELGVAYIGTKEGYYRYFAGAMSFSNKLPECLTSWELEEGEYIVCSFEAEDFEHLVMDAIYKAQGYLFETWLPNHKLNVKPFAIERYARHDAATTCMEVWVLPQDAQ